VSQDHPAGMPGANLARRRATKGRKRRQEPLFLVPDTFSHTLSCGCMEPPLRHQCKFATVVPDIAACAFRGRRIVIGGDSFRCLAYIDVVF